MRKQLRSLRQFEGVGVSRQACDYDYTVVMVIDGMGGWVGVT